MSNVYHDWQLCIWQRLRLLSSTARCLESTATYNSQLISTYPRVVAAYTISSSIPSARFKLRLIFQFLHAFLPRAYGHIIGYCDVSISVPFTSRTWKLIPVSWWVTFMLFSASSRGRLVTYRLSQPVQGKARGEVIKMCSTFHLHNIMSGLSILSCCDRGCKIKFMLHFLSIQDNTIHYL